MFEDVIASRINKGWLLILCLFPFVCIGMYLQKMALTISLSLIWLVPIMLFALDFIPRKVFDLEDKIGYKISRGAIYLLAIQYSILSIAIIGYHIVNFERVLNGSIWINVGVAIIAIVYLMMNFLIIKGFLFSKITISDDIKVPVFQKNDFSEEAKCIFEAAQTYSAIVSRYHEQVAKLHDLNIPVPQEPSETNKTPFVDYLKELSDMPKSHASLASLEQFVLAIADRSELYDFGDKIVENLHGLAGDGVEYVAEVKDLLLSSKQSFIDYLSHHDHETTCSLFNNIKHCVYSDLHGPKIRFDLAHSQGEYGGLSTIFKHLASDVGKGSTATFFDSDKFDEINQSFAEHFSDHIDDIASSMPTDVDIDLWSPDFNCDAHFPLITTAIETFKLGSKYFSDDDIDMGSAFEKSATKIGMTAGGAYLGSALGTLLFPGIGTMIGAMVGGWLGKKGAHSINTVELKRLQGELSNQVQIIQSIAEEAQKNIQRYQKETTVNISYIAYRENQSFQSIKNEDPFQEYSESTVLLPATIILRDYIQELISEFKNGNDRQISLAQVLKRYLPSSQQIKHYPKESLGLLLSSQRYISNNMEENYSYILPLMNEVCISSIVKSIAVLKSLQALWYNKVYTEYKEAIYKVMHESNAQIEVYIEHVDSEKKRVDDEVAKAKRIRKQVEDEAKTL